MQIFLLYVLVSGCICFLYVQLNWEKMEETFPIISPLGKNTVALFQFVSGFIIFPLFVYQSIRLWIAIVHGWYLTWKLNGKIRENNKLKQIRDSLLIKNEKYLAEVARIRSAFEITLFNVDEKDTFTTFHEKNTRTLKMFIDSIVYGVEKGMKVTDNATGTEDYVKTHQYIIEKDGFIRFIDPNDPHGIMNQGYRKIVEIKKK